MNKANDFWCVRKLEKPSYRLDQETKSNNNKHQGEKVSKRDSWNDLEWRPAELIGQWVSFGEGRFDSTTRFLSRSLETARERSGRSP